MSKFYETKNYIEYQIAQKEQELAELRRKAFDAQVREFYWHIENVCDAEKPEFLDASWEISFMGQTVKLNNYANVWEAFHGLLIDYMDEDEIPYERGGDLD